MHNRDLLRREGVMWNITFALSLSVFKLRFPQRETQSLRKMENEISVPRNCWKQEVQISIISKVPNINILSHKVCDSRVFSVLL